MKGKTMNVAHNPFARGAYARETHSNPYTYGSTPNLKTLSCTWCGQSPARLYTYTWQRDDKGDDHFRNGLRFCNLKCHNAYHMESIA